MGKIIIDENELRSLINEAVTNAVDSVTRKIAARAARVNRNDLFRHIHSSDSTPFQQLGCGATAGCGASAGCGRSSYGGCGASNTGGC